MGTVFSSFLDCDWRLLAVSVLCGVLIYKTIRQTFFPRWSGASNVIMKGKSANPITLYVFRGSGVTVSSSPFSSKMEMYCRLTGIPHEIKVADFNKAPKNKVPYMEHDGALFGDSQLMIRYLENTFNISFMSKLYDGKHPFVPFQKLSSADKAQSEFIRILCEENLYWGIVSIKWGGKEGICATETAWQNTVENYFQDIPAVMRGLLTSMIRTDLLRDSWGQGLRRHSPDDQLYLMKRSVETLSVTLGKKTFMLGKSPTECDCIAFGTIDCLLDDSRWPNKLTDFVKEFCPNLVRYHTFIRQTVFEDMKIGDKLPRSITEVEGRYNEL